ncbi:uncharacterized protein LOC125285716 [Alosa alosa]|uniref:uncharacterized protein LOC125285716 n=1 Tax=Alosa alosa TaxID=278164 RepID=UPI002015447A|nr:uncharacterized protein LOC125285716 [Alosa alosa]
MVAGMLMPLDDLRSIYEVLFRDGVMVARKDRRPQCMHPDVPGVSNLKVIRAMGSLKSGAFVRETFAWQHSYWYITNEGIAHMREFLHLPPEIVPSTLHRVRSTASTLNLTRRAAHVQTIKGPTSFIPKPRVKEEQEDLVDRQGYRYKKRIPREQEGQPEKTAMSFRGSYTPSNVVTRPAHSATRETKQESPIIRKQQQQSETSRHITFEEQKISAAAKPGSWKTNRNIKASHSVVAPTEESIASPCETVKMNMPAPPVEAVKEEPFNAQTEAPQPVSETVAVELVQEDVKIPNDQEPTDIWDEENESKDLVPLVEEGASQQEVQESKELTTQTEQEETIEVEQDAPEIYTDGDVPLTVSQIVNEQNASQVVQESPQQIFEPKEQTKQIETMVVEEPLECVMMDVSDASSTSSVIYHEPEADELVEEVTKDLQELLVAEDAEVFRQTTHADTKMVVEETIDAECAVMAENVPQVSVADDSLIVLQIHDEPKGDGQVNEEAGLQQVHEFTVPHIQTEHLPELVVLEPPVQASTSTSAITSVALEDALSLTTVKSLETVSDGTLHPHVSPMTDACVDLSEFEVLDTDISHADVNVSPLPEDC